MTKLPIKGHLVLQPDVSANAAASQRLGDSLTCTGGNGPRSPAPAPPTSSPSLTLTDPRPVAAVLSTRSGIMCLMSHPGVPHRPQFRDLSSHPAEEPRRHRPRASLLALPQPASSEAPNSVSPITPPRWVSVKACHSSRLETWALCRADRLGGPFLTYRGSVFSFSPLLCALHYGDRFSRSRRLNKIGIGEFGFRSALY